MNPPFKDQHTLESLSVSRRSLLKTAFASGAIAVTQSVSAAEKKSAATVGPQIWDGHVHLSAFEGSSPEAKTDSMLEYADRMGIARLITFMGWPWSYRPTPDGIRSENDQVLQALKHAPDRLLGYVYLNPADPSGSLSELRRCVEDGPMVGIKLWVAERCHQSLLDPILEQATKLQAVVYQHTWMKTTGNLEGESTPLDVVELGRRHPESRLICGHSGGNWELGLRVMKQATPNVMFEIAGGDPTAGITERAVQTLGAQRLIYGSDGAARSLATQLAKITGADISEQDKALILGGNLQSLLQPILKTKGVVIQ
ncbi:amidohydrolase family protein [Planctomicrobium sp. SH664]|uniref:amidohydrolase family protein n=1 Tax=Planctomicrobium sp. SH664 TaxID=3448125 RepID=UPI003F5B7887